MKLRGREMLQVKEAEESRNNFLVIWIQYFFTVNHKIIFSINLTKTLMKNKDLFILIKMLMDDFIKL